MRMPWRDPELYPILVSAGLAMAVSLLRNLYDGGRDWKSYLVESLLIGFMTIGIGKGLSAIGADGDWVYFAGSIVGLLGVDFMRFIGEEAIKSRVKK